LVKYLSVPFCVINEQEVTEMTVFRQMYDEWANDLRAKGCGGFIDHLNDYKNTSIHHHGTTSITKTESVNTTSNTESKNEWPHVGIVGPSSPLNQDGETVALSN
jgi:hypothetical protein